MNLVFDIGNSSTKMALFDAEKILFSFRTKDLSTKKIQKILISHRKEIKRAIISSTKKIPEFVPDLISGYIPDIHILSCETKLPFKIKYSTPKTLGSDRIAGVAGAFQKFEGDNALVIDAGSAITTDYLIDKKYRGGNISPGINMRLKALHKYTSRLPLVSLTGKAESPGRSTEEGIEAGVIFGVVYEINEYIRTFLMEHPKGKVILTGGDAEFLKDKLSFPATLIPDLVITGLNFILEYNAK
jgi:type III pantothenate kinase